MYADNDFQLLEARTADVRVEMPWRRKDRPYINPHAVFERKPHVIGEQHEHLTAVIGKNGAGKSHLLSAIVQTFLRLEELHLGKRQKIRDDLPLELLVYRVDGNHCTVVKTGRHSISIQVNGNEVSPRDLPLPKRIVALTISPFDKFPLPRILHRSVVQVDAASSMYQYLGLRDNFGKASIRTLLFRSLSSLFDTTDNSSLRLSNIGAVFEFLGMRPMVNVIYRFRERSMLHDIASGLDPYADGEMSYTKRRLLEDISRSGISSSTLQLLAKLVLREAKGNRIETHADLETGFQDPLFLDLQPLRRAGLLSMSGVEIELKDGGPTDLLQASSGQLSMVSALIALASVIENGSLVLIDEPELSLHPEWQVKYIDLLLRTFARYHGCHFVVATHSPMVISELPDHAEVISLDQEKLPSTKELQGQSADYLLAEVFGAPTSNNLHVRDRVVTALRMIANGDVNTKAFEEALADLRKFATELEPDDPAAELIKNVEEAARDAGTETQS
ncbi:AAA domain-containing protein, putative AbiEii toxin, Type IV TA system [Sulfitobacter litoralis]|jgi:predicted ATPase|uniref:AAA domain-containing protein, putative AbiEii toxin, Type IV TA system n=1 Tax=Sulfitobacter litoralis TaxID=335975 RepID=A0ABY0SR73_9RHOB|nr:ATP-binding protein [Sulfitobacter litoralis]SDP52907.1 AAA domain-containing protein, putative AbiEii toxin, Type IV TA system [Sulfitobacter litoralis]